MIEIGIIAETFSKRIMYADFHYLTKNWIEHWENELSRLVDDNLQCRQYCLVQYGCLFLCSFASYLSIISSFSFAFSDTYDQSRLSLIRKLEINHWDEASNRYKLLAKEIIGVGGSHMRGWSDPPYTSISLVVLAGDLARMATGNELLNKSL